MGNARQCSLLVNRVAMILIYGSPSSLLVLGLAAVHRGVMVLLLHGDVVVVALLQTAQQLVAFVERGLENNIVVGTRESLSGKGSRED